MARLIERYGLPWHCKYSLYYFILTKESKYLERIFPFDVSIDAISEPMDGAFTITVDWIDEFTTKKQWEEIFDAFIAPRQELFWEARGDFSHSRQMDPGTLKQPWIVEFYDFLVEQERSGQRMGVDKALELITNKGSYPPELEGIDRTTLRGYVKRLEGLCRPQE